MFIVSSMYCRRVLRYLLGCEGWRGGEGVKMIGGEKGLGDFMK